MRFIQLLISIGSLGCLIWLVSGWLESIVKKRKSS